MTDLDRHPWLRQRGEKEIEHHAFVLFRGIEGHRELEAVGRLLLTPDQPPEVLMAMSAIADVDAWVRRVAKRREWTTRVLAYDQHMDEARVAEERAGRARMTRNHLTIASTLQHLGILEMTKRIKASEADPTKPTLSAKDTLDILEKGVRLERLNRELPEGTVGLTGGDGGPVKIDNWAALAKFAESAPTAPASSKDDPPKP